jgi:hypothetical protein
MRILDQDSDKPLKAVLIMLTPSEAKELTDKIRQLTSEKGDHLHLDDEMLMREITIAIYTTEYTHTFALRVIELIEKEV